MLFEWLLTPLNKVIFYLKRQLKLLFEWLLILFKWLLTPREIILRQRDRIYNLKLSTKIQGCILSFIIIFFSWMVYSSLFYVQFDELIAIKNKKISALTDNLLLAKEDQKKLGVLEKNYEKTISAFLENTESNLETIEKTIIATGLDANQLVGRSIRDIPSGGPFIPEMDENKNKLVLKFKPKKNQTSSRVNNNIKRLEALQNIMPSLPLVAPLDYYWVSSNYGKRKDPINKRDALHYGIDLVAQTSTIVGTTAPGMVTFAGERSKYGKVVEIDHGYGIRTRYGHLHSISKKKGEVVDFREEIGKLGSSGRATGPHLHYEILYDYKALNPAKFINAGKNIFKKG